MPWITPRTNTRLKLRPIDSSQLSPNEWRDRVSGEKLGIVAVRKAENKHWQVRLAGDLTIGGTKVREVYLWPDHWQGLDQALLASLDAGRQKAIGFNVGTAQKIPGGIELPVAYKSQTDNENNPSGSCNVTSAAICLEYWGIKPTSNRQLEDIIYEWMIDNGLSRHDPIHLKRAIEHFGCRDDFTTRASIAEIKKALDNGNPVIAHGYFTQFGHIIVLIGYTDKGFIVLDPYGEWTADGYLKNDSQSPKRGERIVYSFGLIERCCLPDGGCWAHFVTRSGVQAKQSNPPPAKSLRETPKYKPQEFRLNSVAIALIKSFEGLELSAYVCSAGVLTIGLGTTVYPDGSPVQWGDTCTEAQAIEWFSHDSDRFIKALRNMVDVPLTGLQIAALTSFIYNCGEGAFEESTLRREINANASISAIEAQLMRWTNNGLAGLVSRRNAECALWRGEKDWERYR